MLIYFCFDFREEVLYHFTHIILYIIFQNLILIALKSCNRYTSISFLNQTNDLFFSAFGWLQVYTGLGLYLVGGDLFVGPYFSGPSIHVADCICITKVYVLKFFVLISYLSFLRLMFLILR